MGFFMQTKKKGSKEAKSHFSLTIDNGQHSKRSHLEASTADQEAIDVWAVRQLFGIGALDRPSINDTKTLEFNAGQACVSAVKLVNFTSRNGRGH